MNQTIKTVLVTGSNGLLGQKLTDIYMTIPDIRFVGTGIGPSRHPDSEGLEYYSMDICSKTEVDAIIDLVKPNCIIHTAAMTNVDECESQKERCREMNVFAVQYLVEAANRVNAQFIHLSTDFIFDGANGPYSEEDLPAPLSFYGQSKLDGENIVRQNSKSWAIVRTVLVYGLVQDMSRSNVVLWAKNALESGKTIRVVDDQYRTPTLAEDLAMGCRLIEAKEAKGIYNICGKDLMNIYELVQRVADKYGLSIESVQKVKSNTLNQPATRPPFTGLKIDKAVTELGYNPRSFEEGMEILEAQLMKYTK